MAAATLVGEEAQEDETSLESEFFELLVASERVGTLVDRIQDTACFQRYHPLLFGPLQSVEPKESSAMIS